jgi:hypothetical protein
MPLSRRTFLLLATASLSFSITRPLAAAGSGIAERLAPFLGVWEVERRQPEQSEDDGKRRRPSRFRPPPGEDVEPNDIIPDMSHGDRHVLRIMTDEGRAAFEALAESGVPAGDCRPPVLPRIARLPGLQDWRLKDGTLEIRHAYDDTRRVVHLGRREAPSGTPFSQAGYACGWFDGDIFVIQTTHLAATPSGLSRHAPASDARVVEERYRLGRNGGILKGEFTITDAKYLIKPIYLHSHLNRAPAGTAVKPALCGDQ